RLCQFARLEAEEAGRGPSQIRTGDGGFAIRDATFPTLDTPSQLRQSGAAEVPPVVPTTLHCTCINSHSPEITKIANAYPDLPAVVKAGILAMIGAAEGAQMRSSARE